MPIILSSLAGLHIFYLHLTGSSNPLGLSAHSDKVTFSSYFSIKDFFGFSLFLTALFFLVFFFPNFFMEADNFIPANTLVTPTHIVPEWYFLFAYAILRSVPLKLGGVIALFLSVLVLGTLCFSHTLVIKSLSFYGPVKAIFWVFVCVFFLLTLAGSWPLEAPFIFISFVLSCLYFSFYLFLGISRYFWDLVLL